MPGEISAQLAQTSIGSSLSPRTPDNVFSSPPSRHTSSVFSPDQNTKDSQSQTVGDIGAQRYLSERAGSSQKQTAAISPLLRSSTGSMPNPQRGIGRGAGMQKTSAGIGRGQQLKNDRGPPPQLPYTQDMTGLNPNIPAFVPSPKRDGSSDGMVNGQMQQQHQPLGAFVDPYGNRQAPVPAPGGMPLMPGTGQNMLPRTFPEFDDLFKPIPLLPPSMPPHMPPNMPPHMPPNMRAMPPMPSRSGAMGMNQLPPPPPNLRRGVAMAPPPFPPQPNLMPGLPLPSNFDLMSPPHGQMFDPNTPPPAFFGLGRGHQAWSVND